MPSKRSGESRGTGAGSWVSHASPPAAGRRSPSRRAGRGQPGRFPARPGRSRAVAERRSGRDARAWRSGSAELVVVPWRGAEFARRARVRDVLALGWRPASAGSWPAVRPRGRGGGPAASTARFLLRAQHHRTCPPADQAGRFLAGHGRPAQSASAGGEFDDPANTDSRAKSSCSAAEPRS